ncbi:MAG: N-carbamoylputrescine amidase [Pseudomonadota bacterium]
MSTITVAAIQCALPGPADANIAVVETHVRAAARQGAKIILPPELFEGPYFCQTEELHWFETAKPTAEHPSVLAMQKLAKELQVYIPTSFFERDGQHYYNSLAMIDDAGDIMGVYRKSHIPDGPGYEEKFYFRPGNTGFKVWDTKYGRLGIGICWDQWYPETARALMLMGADILMFPTAIGDEPEAEDLDTSRLWRRAMIGHSVSNVVPVVASNRIGPETGSTGNTQTFYGHSFITNERGDFVGEFGAEESGVLIATFDLNEVAKNRAAFGFFRDRRPQLYGRLVEDI